MVVIGLLIFALAVAAAIVAIAQNQSAMVDVHGLGYSWNVHVYWVLVAGLVIAAVGFLGVAVMRTGAAHAARLRHERRGLARENARLSGLAADRPAEPVVADTRAVPVATSTSEPVADARATRDDAVTYESSPAPRHQFFHRTRQV